MKLIENRKDNFLSGDNIPVWFMRQAGRYHAHYQNIKKDSDFMTMCKDANLACEITMGPINEFGFDAAILFSDLLFPLEQLGLGLSYLSGPPTLELKLSSLDDIKKCKLQDKAENFYQFQQDALIKLKEKLPADKDLLGFVGAPFTLYSYAVEGKHSGNLISSKQGFYDGRFQAFMELLIPNLVENMKIQAAGGADIVCLFDTAAGELDFHHYKNFCVPMIKLVTKEFKQAYPDKKIIYYSKLTHMNYLQCIEDDNIDVLGIDWRFSLKDALKTLGNDYFIQGNIDPSLLHLPWNDLEKAWARLWQDISGSNNLPLNKWIAGLGHGVLPLTPESNVLKSVQYIHQNFKV